MLFEWEFISLFFFVIIINIVRCHTVVVCEMLWPKLFTKMTSILMNLESLDIFFLKKVNVFLSVCTVYFPNIIGSGNLNRQP
jgi:hypothetical protein